MQGAKSRTAASESERRRGEKVGKTSEPPRNGRNEQMNQRTTKGQMQRESEKDWPGGAGDHRESTWKSKSLVQSRVGLCFNEAPIPSPPVLTSPRLTNTIAYSVPPPAARPTVPVRQGQPAVPSQKPSTGPGAICPSRDWRDPPPPSLPLPLPPPPLPDLADAAKLHVRGPPDAPHPSRPTSAAAPPPLPRV